MEIIIDNGCYELYNMGDIAMLKTAVNRLKSFYPGATVKVLTTTPDLLNFYCPQAVPLCGEGKYDWFNNRNILKKHLKSCHWRIRKAADGIEDAFSQHFPAVHSSLIVNVMNASNLDVSKAKNFVSSLAKADIVIAAGGGYINDQFPEIAVSTMAVLSTAKNMGKITAMFGQGIGPLTSDYLKGHVRQSLAEVDLICLRENRIGPSLVESLGVSRGNYHVTGDDALELAFDKRDDHGGGQGVGINIRRASYSNVDRDSTGIVQQTIQKFAQKVQSPLIPIPISRHRIESDAGSLRDIFGNSLAQADGGESLDTPEKVIDQIKHCRVVVTGSYHAAVFSLALGIPVVGIARSHYYSDKFLGLSDLYGQGCSVIHLDERDAQEKLERELTDAWESSMVVSTALLSRTEELIRAGKGAYQKFYTLVEKKGHA